MSVKIVSLNCWSGRLYEPLLRFLSTYDADIYCLQEVNASTVEMPSVVLHPTDEGRSPVRPRLLSEIEAVLPEHVGFFRPFAQGFLHDAAPVTHPVRFGIAMFVRKNLPIIGEHSGFVHGAYRSGGARVHPGPRNAHCVRIWRHDVGQPLTVAHMHGLWVPELGKVDTPERDAQAYALAHVVRAVAQKNDPVVVCGDFNVLPESSTLRILKQTLKVSDLVTSRGYSDTRTTLYTKTPRFADYMLVSPDVQVQSFQVPAYPEVSDHRPLILEIE